MPDKYLLEHAERWRSVKLYDISLNIITSVMDATLQPLNPKWKYWYDEGNKTLNIMLPLIKSEGELDDVILTGVLCQRGLPGLLNESQLNSLGRIVFNNCDAVKQKLLLGQILGNAATESAQSAAGNLFIIESAKDAYKAAYKSREEYTWFKIVNNYIRDFLRPIVSFTSLSRSLFANAIGNGIRQNLSQLSNEATLSQSILSSESLREYLTDLAERERLNKPIDRKRIVTIGKVPNILIQHSARIRSEALLELPLSALYGRPNGENPKRFVVVGVDKTKRDKHPFNLHEIRNLKEALESPLAIFNSTRNSASTTVMLSLKSNEGNMLVPISRRENNALISGPGRWINRIDSIYPKDDLSYIFILADKKNVLYVEKEFLNDWMMPAARKIDFLCKKKANQFGIHLPSDSECKKILSEYPITANYEEEETEGPIKRLLSATDLKGPSGFLRMYAEYRVSLESATKVVKEILNPFITKH